MFQASAYLLLFLTCVVVLAKVRARRVRQMVLLVASFALYLTWTPWFAAVLIASIVVNFWIGMWLRRKLSAIPLWTGIVFNLALLATFKYLPKVASHTQISSLRGFAQLALPLGISFWTFQAMSYLFDLYREEELDPSFVEFALYMSFFPVTVSGPVCRMPEMLPQFRPERPTAWDDILAGLRRIAIGIFMMELAKLLGQGILDGDGIVSGFDRLTRWSGADVWCLAFGYGLQLFFDFAGYTHIAIGAAKALGIIVPENFQRPFASTTPSVFWTRWHMSLSFWIRDYVFLPLAVLRREVWWRNLALILSMIVFGVWHKATLLFLLWGCYHGVLLVCHRQWQQLERRLNWNSGARPWTAFSWVVTISLISLGWIFFRANSPPQAMQMFSAIVSARGYASHSLSLSLYLLVAALAAGYALVLVVDDALRSYALLPDTESQSGLRSLVARWRWFWVPSVYAIALIFVLLITHGQQVSAGQLMYRSF